MILSRRSTLGPWGGGDSVPALGAAWNSSGVIDLIFRFFIRTRPPFSGTSLRYASTSSGESFVPSSVRSFSFAPQSTTTSPCAAAPMPLGVPSRKGSKSLRLLGGFLLTSVYNR